MKIGPSCTMCNTPVKWNYTAKTWRLYCSPECAKKDKKSQTSKQKQTCLDKYGVHSTALVLEFKEKRAHTNQLKYGGHPKQTKEVQDKYKNTCLERFGTEHPWLNPDIRDKAIQTFKQKYGSYYAVKTPDKIEKSKQALVQTNLMLYGTTHQNQKHMVDVIPFLEDYDWLYTEYVIKRKTPKQIAKDLKVSSATILNYLHTHDINIIYTRQHSCKSIEWLNTIGTIYFRA